MVVRGLGLESRVLIPLLINSSFWKGDKDFGLQLLENALTRISKHKCLTKTSRLFIGYFETKYKIDTPVTRSKYHQQLLIIQRILKKKNLNSTSNETRKISSSPFPIERISNLN